MMKSSPPVAGLVVAVEEKDPTAKALAIAKKALADIAACCGDSEDMDGEMDDDEDEDVDAMISKAVG